MNKKRIITVSIIVAAVLVVAAAVFGFFCVRAAESDTILPGTVISGVEVGGMTQDEAIARLNETLGSVYADASLPLTLEGGNTLSVSAADAQAGFEIEDAVAQAYTPATAVRCARDGI
jgi:flagellar basal body-associated protein FliL